jgi:hypothetical protein
MFGHSPVNGLQCYCVAHFITCTQLLPTDIGENDGITCAVGTNVGAVGTTGSQSSPRVRRAEKPVMQSVNTRIVLYVMTRS